MLPVLAAGLLGGWTSGSAADKPPVSPKDLVVKVPAPGKTQTEVKVLPDGTLVVGGKPITVEKLSEILKENVKKDADHFVLLRAEKNAPYKQVAKLFDACAAAGVWNVALPVTK